MGVVLALAGTARYVTSRLSGCAGARNALPAAPWVVPAAPGLPATAPGAVPAPSRLRHPWADAPGVRLLTLRWQPSVPLPLGVVAVVHGSIRLEDDDLDDPRPGRDAPDPDGPPPDLPADGEGPEAEPSEDDRELDLPEEDPVNGC